MPSELVPVVNFSNSRHTTALSTDLRWVKTEKSLKKNTLLDWTPAIVHIASATLQFIRLATAASLLQGHFSDKGRRRVVCFITEAKSSIGSHIL